MKTLYQYSIKVDGQKTFLQEYMGSGKRPNIISCVYDNAEDSPIVAAGILRDLAEWVLEQAEHIEELETGTPTPKRDLGKNYKAGLEAV